MSATKNYIMQLEEEERKECLEWHTNLMRLLGESDDLSKIAASKDQIAGNGTEKIGV